MIEDECIPARYVQGKKKGQIILCDRHRLRIARLALTKRDGPPPSPDKNVCRHTCDNDSQSHKRQNGFVCTLHTMWGTQKENMMDKPEEVRKASARKGSEAGSSKGGKVGGKTTGSIERTCPHCGRTIKGPSYFQHERACKHRHSILSQYSLPEDL